MAIRLRVPESPNGLVHVAPVPLSGLSKHLRALTGAGILSTRRQGWYVLYELRRDRLEELGPELLDYLG